MKRLLMLAALLTAFVFTMDAQNNYSRLWSKVRQAEKEGKPQTAAGYLRELEEKTIKAGDVLEQLVVSEALYDDLRKYNWKEANAYYSTYANLSRRVLSDSLDTYIEKFADHPRIMMLLDRRLRNHKQALDGRWSRPATGAEYLAVRKEAEELLRHKRVGSYKQGIQALIDAMDSQSLSNSHHDTMAPGEAGYTVNTRNVKEVEVKVYRLLDDRQFFDGFKNSTEETLRKNGTLVSTRKITGLKSEYNIREESRTTVDFPEPGVYVVRFAAASAKETDENVSYDQVFVSNVVGALRTREGKAEVYAADFHTGKPFGEGRVSLYKNLLRYNHSAIVKLNAERTDTFRGEGFQAVNIGNALEDRENEYQLRVDAGGDIYACLMGLMNEYPIRYTDHDYTYEQAAIFTDRALYKPTDTIHFKIICFKGSQTSGDVLPDKTLNVRLRHVSEDKPVAELKLITNAMGSAAGAFTLPEGAKNGNYYIEAEYLASRRVRVEEYKRPNFMVTLEPVTEALAYGDIVKQTGQLRSFAGYSVAGGEVAYTIRRTSHLRTGGRYLGSETILEGSVISDGDGRFEIVFPANRPQLSFELKESDLMYSRYDIAIRAVDPQGETHESSISVPVADIPVDLNVQLPDNTSFRERLIVDKDNVKSVTVTGSTLNGTPYACPVTWTVLDAAGAVVKQGEGVTNDPIAFDFGALPSGDYNVKAVTDFRGRALEAERKVVVLSTNDWKLPFQTDYFYYPIRTEGAIEFVLGTTEDDLYLELELFDNDRQLYREGVHLQNEMRKFSIPYKSEWRSAVKMSVFGIREGRELDYTYQFTRPGDVRLDVAIETLRDKTTPGSTERMTLRAPAGSELLVSIYDVTTDRYQPNSFAFYPLREYVSISRPDIQSSLNPRHYYPMNDRMLMKGAAGAVMADAMVEQEDASVANAQEEEAGDTPEFQGRTNFSELVAFYPQLQADPSGTTEITYTVSDLLTTYKVLVLAHDQRVFAGDASAEFIVQQELMVQPNVPLFATEGDQIVFKSKLVNLSDKELKGTAYIEILDDQGKKLKLKGMGSQKRTLLAGAQDEVAWTVTVPGGTGKLTVKIWFVTPTSSDGEVHELTVVPNTITLTEAASFVIGQGKTHKYYEKQLRKQFGADNPIIEYAEYSTLDAVMESLPKAVKPASENAIDWINQLYINQMRNFVLKDDPADYAAFRSQAFSALKTFQKENGFFAWFRGMNDNLTITLYFLEKVGQLRQVGAIALSDDEMAVVRKAAGAIDWFVAENFESVKEYHAFASIRSFAVRSLWFDLPMSDKAKKVFQVFIDKTEDGWQDISILEKAQLCNTMLRAKDTQYDDKRFTKRIKLLRESLKDYAVENPTIGCYFPNAVMPYRGLMNSEIYAHAQLIETFGALGEKKMVDGIAQWLLLQKHNQAWENTVATTDAVHALVSSKAKDLKLGAVYYTYTTKLDKVKAAANELSVNRSYTRASGAPLSEGEALHVGDEIIVTYYIHNTENRSFVQLRAMRPAAFYPVDERSYYSWYGWYYREVKPSETNYYWELLPEENTSVQERFYVQQEGVFSSGLIEIECLFAKEYRGHTDAITVTTK